MPSAERPRRSRRANFLLLAGVVAAGLVLFELVLRATVYPVQKPQQFEKGVVVADAAIGYRLRPRHRSIMTDGHFRAVIETDRYGLRDVYDPALPDEGLVAIGDSQTFGQGIAAADTWVEQLQRKLGVNVRNAGVFGYAVTQYRPLLERLVGEGVRVREVLLALSWNDVASGGLPVDSNIVVDGLLAPNPRYASRARPFDGLRRLARRVATVRLAADAALNLAGMLGIRHGSYAAYDRMLVEKVEVTKRDLARLDAFVRSLGGRLTIVHIANGNFVRPEVWARYRTRHRHGRYFARDHLAAWAAERGIAFADAIDRLERGYLASGRRLDWLIVPSDGHYNRGANGVIAEIFYELVAGRRKRGAAGATGG